MKKKTQEDFTRLEGKKLPAYMTTGEVMKVLSLSRITLRRWRLAGKIPYVRLGTRDVRYPRSGIQQLLGEIV